MSKEFILDKANVVQQMAVMNETYDWRRIYISNHSACPSIWQCVGKLLYIGFLPKNLLLLNDKRFHVGFGQYCIRGQLH